MHIQLLPSNNFSISIYIYELESFCKALKHQPFEKLLITACSNWIVHENLRLTIESYKIFIFIMKNCCTFRLSTCNYGMHNSMDPQLEEPKPCFSLKQR